MDLQLAGNPADCSTRIKLVNTIGIMLHLFVHQGQQDFLNIRQSITACSSTSSTAEDL